MLKINLDKSLLQKEFDYYKNHQGNLCYSNKNYIIRYFQQDVFYKKENELFNNNEIKEKLISNRCKYLNKTINELTDNELLLGFKYSGIYWGYSHFNPLIFKYFINEFNINICYDPCGGWGHRLLGGLQLTKYIYNDISYNVLNNCKNIVSYFNINNVIFYNYDCRDFIPSENFDAIFTCPPYYNMEKYDNEFLSFNEYMIFIDNLFNIFLNSSALIFGLVIREDLLKEEYKELSYKKFIIRNYGYLHLSKKKQHINNEYLYIFVKNEL
jgi:hypothetical protein